MKIYNFTDDEAVVVKGKQGVDNVNATVPANSFIVPKENAPVAVKLTPGEVVVPPSQMDILRSNAAKLGIKMQDLAPKGRYTYPQGQDINAGDREGYTESQLRDRNASITTEEIENTGIYSDFRKNNQPIVQGYDKGGYVNAQGVLVDEDGNPMYKRKLNQQAAEALGVGNADINAMAKNVNPSKNAQSAEQQFMSSTVPETQGIAENRSNLDKIYDIIGRSTPKIDEQKAERLKKIAGINAIGKGISTLFSTISAGRGGPVFKDTNDITPKALAEYNTMISKDKDNQYRTALQKANAGITSLKEEQAIIMANKKYNQELKADWNKLTAKITLEDIRDNNKRAQRWQEMLYKQGIDINVDNVRTENDLRVVKEQGKNAKAVAYIRQSDEKSNSADKNIITFGSGSNQDEIDVDSAVAFAVEALAEKQRYYADEDNTASADDDTDYKLLQNAVSNGYTPGELKAIITKMYPKSKDKYGIYSKKDKDRAAYITPGGKVQTVDPLKANQNPSRQPVEPDPDDRFKKKKAK